MSLTSDWSVCSISLVCWRSCSAISCCSKPTAWGGEGGVRREGEEGSEERGERGVGRSEERGERGVGRSEVGRSEGSSALTHCLSSEAENFEECLLHRLLLSSC